MRPITRVAVTAVAAAGLLGGTALAASAAAPTVPVFTAVITGPHAIQLTPGETVVAGERVQPQTPFYGASVPVTAVAGRTVTTGSTFLPLNKIGQSVTFKVTSLPA